MSRSNHDSDVEDDMAEFVLVETPSAAAAAAEAPPAPPFVKRQRAVSTDRGRASSVAAAIAAVSLNEPKVKATLLHESYPTDNIENFETKLRVDVSPSDHMPTPSCVDVVLCLDASVSMGLVSNPVSGATLLKKFLIELIERGVPEMDLNLRILEFGRTVVDRRTDSVEELVRLNDASRAKFMAAAELYNPSQGCTDISSPVKHAIGAIRAHHLRQKERGVTPAEVAHVICLTDGIANSGLREGSACLGAARHAMGESDIFVHYIGLGASVDADFMTKATASGDAGVFAVAPTASKISHAFEEVFGFALATTLPLTVEVADANGVRIEKKGMLIKERSLLLDVALPVHKEACVANDVSVRLMIGGNCLTEITQIPVTYSESGYGIVNSTVKELIEVEEIKNVVCDIMKNAPDMETASQSIRGMIRRKEASGDYCVQSLSSAVAVADDVDQDAAIYRSCGANGVQLYVARMTSQAAYS